MSSLLIGRGDVVYINSFGTRFTGRKLSLFEDEIPFRVFTALGTSNVNRGVGCPPRQLERWGLDSNSLNQNEKQRESLPRTSLFHYDTHIPLEFAITHPSRLGIAAAFRQHLAYPTQASRASQASQAHAPKRQRGVQKGQKDHLAIKERRMPADA
ncbi:MAG: hypothetical protein L6R40_000513 [Gallowayella cf. fulva]|nr:MAG: hypothetical protein L6R40_000513 [Xanthomendoza cf. fulva]